MPLKELGWNIGIEDGRMYKAFQVENNVEELPHCYIIGKNNCVVWHGHPISFLKVYL